MFLKVGVKVLFVMVELFLGFYSLVISESLLVKFIFFVVTAAIVAFGILKTINKVLPANGEMLQLGSEDEE
ncbi:hypothetical protein [Christiangramia sp. OXR-203]|jgi:hypothetical protein|uniref:hypothetical protein n=1 Tax=unclassified Christiangramia TaxID=2615027 RepID=UPI002AC99E87|nr:hypothetical protein [Christiangramia sp. OXR-203]WPY98238.1 hypothetical protein T8I65_13790 [Christiangramia sp. OXR-203]